jgi:holo-[acyl-carrier protein] synthase
LTGKTVRVGIDLVEIARIEKVIERFGRRFLHRVFTAEEIDCCERHPNPFQSFAARFAAKEAIGKALGTGISRGVRWKDLIIVDDEHARPVARLAGRAESLAPGNPHISLSHTKELAIALCVFQGPLDGSEF